MQHASMSTQDGIHAKVITERRRKACKNVSRNIVLIHGWTVHLIKMLRGTCNYYIYKSYWEEILSKWNGKALEKRLQSREREFDTTIIWTVVSISQKESGYLCKQRQTDFDLKCNGLQWLLFIISKYIRIHHVLSLLSISLTFDNRVYVGIKVYFLHFV